MCLFHLHNIICTQYIKVFQVLAKFPHSPILHYACRSLLTENNGKNNAIAMGLCAVFVVSWWRNKGLHTLNRMHNEAKYGAVRKFSPSFF